MVWESTDQFGNLCVAVSEASSIAALQPELESMVEEVFLRNEGAVTFSIDPSYGEISAPDGNQVTHILSVSLFQELMDEGMENPQIIIEVGDMIKKIASTYPGRNATVCGPWD